MNKIEAKRLNEELRAAAEVVFQKYGLKVERSVINYSDNSVDLKIEAFRQDDNGKKIIDNDIKYMALQALIVSNPMFKDITDPDYIFESTFFVSNLGFCKIIDFNPRCRRYPFVVRLKNGKEYKVNERVIEHC